MDEGAGVEQSPLAHTREVFERALTVAGLHFAEGAKIWRTYIEFEKIVDGADVPSPEQVSRIRSLYHRFLKVPQAGKVPPSPLPSLDSSFP